MSETGRRLGLGWLGNRSIATKIAIVVVVSALSTIGLALAALLQMSHLRDNVKTVNERNMVRLGHVSMPRSLS